MLKLSVKLPRYALQALRVIGGKAPTHIYVGPHSASHPDRDLPRETPLPVPTVQEAVWASELVWTQRLEEKSKNHLSLPDIEPRSSSL
jgi:hypothetical protein